MLIELFGRNFGSFRDEFRLSMLATDIDPGNERGVVAVALEGEDEPLRLLRCAAIYGPNASGKSTVLRAASALNHLLGFSAGFSSDQPLSPFEPFLLDGSWAGRAVMLGIRAVINRRVYEYAVEFDRTRFLLEKLIEIAPTDSRTLFERREQVVDGDWTFDEQFELLMRSFRPNALLLSLADVFVPNLAKGLAVGFRRLLGYHDSTGAEARYSSQRVGRLASEDQGFGQWLVGWLRDADVGIVDYDLQRVQRQPRLTAKGTVTIPRIPRQSEFQLTLLHASPDGAVPISYHRESMGTRKMLEIAPFIHELTHGDQVRAYFIDEIAASVHPQLLLALLRQFNCDIRAESVRGQLIFATHETIMLDDEAKDAVLRRDQVYLTEKDATGASRLYSVAEFKERNNLNLRRRYLQGRYGAVPSLGGAGD